MAPMTVFYRKIVSGVGYRFALPLLDVPSPSSGDLTDITVTLFLKDPDTAVYGPQQEPDLPPQRKDSDDCVTLDVSAAGAIWLLPLISPSGPKPVQHFLLSVRRVPASQSPAAAGPTSSTATTISAANECSIQPLAAKKTDIGAFYEAFDFSQDDMEDADSEDECRVTELGINKTYGNTITRTRYVDVLYKGDSPPQRNRDVDVRLFDPLAWSINIRDGTWYRRAQVNRGKRSADWVQLLNEGLPCRVKDNAIDIVGRGFSYFGLETMSTILTDGNARFRLVRNKGDYACQPATASAYASHMLNTYSIMVHQKGTDIPVYAPAGEPVERRWDFLLHDLAEYSSAAGGHSIIFSEEPHRGRYAEDVMGFGVRLRDGGARLPLLPVRGFKGLMKLELPGRHYHYTGWDTTGDGLNLYTYIAQIVLPLSNERRDMVLRVRERADGDYRSIEYAPRPRGNCAAIKEEEWQRLGDPVVQDDSVLHMVNAARLSYGRAVLENQDELDSSNEAQNKKQRLA